MPARKKARAALARGKYRSTGGRGSGGPDPDDLAAADRDLLAFDGIAIAAVDDRCVPQDDVLLIRRHSTKRRMRSASHNAAAEASSPISLRTSPTVSQIDRLPYPSCGG